MEKIISQCPRCGRKFDHKVNLPQLRKDGTLGCLKCEMEETRVKAQKEINELIERFPFIDELFTPDDENLIKMGLEGKLDHLLDWTVITWKMPYNYIYTFNTWGEAKGHIETKTSLCHDGVEYDDHEMAAYLVYKGHLVDFTVKLVAELDMGRDV